MDHLAAEDLDTPRAQIRRGRRAPLRTLANLNDRGDLEAPIQGAPRGLQAKVARPQNHDPATGEGVVSLQQRGQAIGAHHAGLIPTGEGERDVAGAGGQDQLAKADHPGAILVSQPDHRFRQGSQPRPVDKRAPGVGSERHLDAQLQGDLQIGTGRQELFDHPRRPLHGRRHATPVVKRRIQAHQARRHRVLVHQQHLGAQLRRLDSRRDPGWPRADHQDIDRALRAWQLSVQRMGVRYGHASHQTASSACSRSAIRSSGCSSPTDSRRVASSMPEASRVERGTA